MATLDGELVLLLTDLDEFERDVPGVPANFDPSKPIAISIKFAGDVAQFAGTGFTISTSGGGVAYGLADIRAIRTLAKHPAVLFIGKQRLEKLELNKSILEIHANTSWMRTGDHFSGYIGKRVLVGIIDSGIDFTHHDQLKPIMTN